MANKRFAGKETVDNHSIVKLHYYCTAAMLYYTILHTAAVLYYTILHFTVLWCTVLHCVVLSVCLSVCLSVLISSVSPVDETSYPFCKVVVTRN